MSAQIIDDQEKFFTGKRQMTDHTNEHLSPWTLFCFDCDRDHFGMQDPDGRGSVLSVSPCSILFVYS